MHKLVLFCFCLIFQTDVLASDFVQFEGPIKRIYNSILNLDFNYARDLLFCDTQQKTNYAYVLMANELDFFEIFISENLYLFNKRKSFKNLRLKKIKNSSLPVEWKSFLTSEVLLQWALLELKMGSSLIAFTDFRKALTILEETKQKYPHFMYTYKSLGVLHSLVGSIPDEFSWIKNLINLNGSISLGKKETNLFLNYAKNNADLFYLESTAANALIISFLENKPEEGYLFWKKSSEFCNLNPMSTFIEARLAMKSFKNEEAIICLSLISETKKEIFPYLFFMEGLTKLQQLNGAAEIDFKKYLEHFHGNSYIKETYQKLSWCALLKSDLNLFKFYQSKIGMIGNTKTDEDKKAQNDYLTNDIPDLILLKCRLLFDGGYASRSLKLLETRIATYYENPKLKTECAYRMGRILQSKKEFNGALLYFNDAIKFDVTYKTFYASASLLYSGQIWEIIGDFEKSCQAYRNTLKTHPQQFAHSIHQKARAGIIRLGVCK